MQVKMAKEPLISEDDDSIQSIHAIHENLLKIIKHNDEKLKFCESHRIEDTQIAEFFELNKEFIEQNVYRLLEESAEKLYGHLFGLYLSFLVRTSDDLDIEYIEMLVVYLAKEKFVRSIPDKNICNITASSQLQQIRGEVDRQKRIFSQLIAE